MYLREETKLEFRLPSPVFLIGLSTQLSPAERTGDKVAGAVPHLGACFPQACRAAANACGGRWDHCAIGWFFGSSLDLFLWNLILCYSREARLSLKSWGLIGLCLFLSTAWCGTRSTSLPYVFTSLYEKSQYAVPQWCLWALMCLLLWCFPFPEFRHVSFPADGMLRQCQWY